MNVWAFFVLERGGKKEGFYFICFASNREEFVLILLLSVSRVLLLTEF